MFDLTGKKFKAYGKQLLILRDDQKKESGGIHIPEESREFGWLGTVLQAGHFATDFKENDRIIFQKAHTVLPFNNRRLAMTTHDTIAAKLVDNGDYEELHVRNDFLLIEPEQGKRDEGGIIKAYEKRTVVYGGLVTRVGDGCSGDIKVGSWVFYNHNLAMQCAEAGQYRHILAEEHVLCQIPKCKKK